VLTNGGRLQMLAVDGIDRYNTRLNQRRRRDDLRDLGTVEGGGTLTSFLLPACNIRVTFVLRPCKRF
jgi:hypothetical protein